MDRRTTTLSFFWAISAYTYFVAVTPFFSTFDGTRSILSVTGAVLLVPAVAVFRTKFYDQLLASNSPDRQWLGTPVARAVTIALVLTTLALLIRLAAKSPGGEIPTSQLRHLQSVTGLFAYFSGAGLLRRGAPSRHLKT